MVGGRGRDRPVHRAVLCRAARRAVRHRVRAGRNGGRTSPFEVNC